MTHHGLNLFPKPIPTQVTGTPWITRACNAKYANDTNIYPQQTHTARDGNGSDISHQSKRIFSWICKKKINY